MKFLLMVAIPVLMMSCNEGKHKNNNDNHDNMNEENKGTNHGMDRDTLSQSSLMINLGKEQNVAANEDMD